MTHRSDTISFRRFVRHAFQLSPQLQGVGLSSQNVIVAIEVVIVSIEFVIVSIEVFAVSTDDVIASINLFSFFLFFHLVQIMRRTFVDSGIAARRHGRQRGRRRFLPHRFGSVDGGCQMRILVSV